MHIDQLQVGQHVLWVRKRREPVACTIRRIHESRVEVVQRPARVHRWVRPEVLRPIERRAT